jgi:hypothetical protein
MANEGCGENNLEGHLDGPLSRVHEARRNWEDDCDRGVGCREHVGGAVKRSPHYCHQPDYGTDVRCFGLGGGDVYHLGDGDGENYRVAGVDENPATLGAGDTIVLPAGAFDRFSPRSDVPLLVCGRAQGIASVPGVGIACGVAAGLA